APRCPALPLSDWGRLSAPPVPDLVQPCDTHFGRARDRLAWHTAHAHSIADDATPGGVLPLQLGKRCCACPGHRTHQSHPIEVYPVARYHLVAMVRLGGRQAEHPPPRLGEHLARVGARW